MITDKSRYGHDAVLDVNCGDSVQVLRTEPMTLTEQEQKIVQKYLGIALLEKSYIDANGHLMVVLSDGRTLDVGSARGLPGATPYLGENGNWFVEGMDTLQSARGLPGFTPYIGENEHWWIDETDTGIPARGIPLTEKADSTRFLRNDGTWQKVTPENIGAAKQSVVADHESRIEALEQRTVTAPYYTDDSVAYIKDVPENALPFASVDMVGGMTRKCTNLIRSPYDEGSGTIQKSGITFTVNADGSVTANGTASADVYFRLKNVQYLAGVSYFLSGCPSGGSWEKYVLYDDVAVITDTGNGAAILKSEKTDGIIYIRIWSGATLQNVTFRPMLNSGTEPLPYEPYFDGLRSAPATEVKSVGRNLLPMEDISKNVLGCDVIVSNGVITIKGTATGSGGRLDPISTVTLPAGTYFLAVDGIAADKDFFLSRIGGGNNIVAYNRTYFTLTEKTQLVFGRNFTSGNTYSITARAHINRGTTSLPYEPYRSDALLVSAEVQDLDGYGGGINDEVYNYIDLENKRFAKRVDKDTWNGTESTIVKAENIPFFRVTLSSASKQYASGHGNKGICSLYNVFSGVQHSNCPDMSIMIAPLSVSNMKNVVFVKDSRFTTAEEFKAFLAEQSAKGNPLEIAYELAEPVITDISDILPDDNLIGVEGGGTVTMVNEYGYDVPSEITYARLILQ